MSLIKKNEDEIKIEKTLKNLDYLSELPKFDILNNIFFEKSTSLINHKKFSYSMSQLGVDSNEYDENIYYIKTNYLRLTKKYLPEKNNSFANNNSPNKNNENIQEKYEKDYILINPPTDEEESSNNNGKKITFSEICDYIFDLNSILLYEKETFIEEEGRFPHLLLTSYNLEYNTVSIKNEINKITNGLLEPMEIRIIPKKEKNCIYIILRLISVDEFDKFNDCYNKFIITHPDYDINFDEKRILFYRPIEQYYNEKFTSYEKIKYQNNDNFNDINGNNILNNEDKKWYCVVFRNIQKEISKNFITNTLKKYIDSNQLKLIKINCEDELFEINKKFFCAGVCKSLSFAEKMCKIFNNKDDIKCNLHKYSSKVGEHFKGFNEQKNKGKEQNKIRQDINDRNSNRIINHLNRRSLEKDIQNKKKMKNINSIKEIMKNSSNKFYQEDDNNNNNNNFSL